ncbi:DUF1707 SHOCT-like domain-containing protein [Nocardioides speluncae]|uniref:DUF1707 SHOCT-like domain-containing protein n=1 Tax=Nocardioides speluncae TaxID=2670337 RepID=UPI000D689483|nr:DUF1707 domain-containing protein [Nocardioides speluncae]
MTARPQQPWSSARPRPWAEFALQQVASANGSLRVGDAEREEAASALGEHFAQGRLSREEYDDRLAAAFAAKTGGDLQQLFRDLPAPHPGAPARVAAARPRPGRPRGFRLPVFPMLLVLIGLAIVLDAWWVLFVGLGVVWCLGSSRRRRRWHAAYHQPYART